MKRKHIIGLILAAVVVMIIIRLAANKKELDKKNEPAKDASVSIPVKVAEVKEQQGEISLVKTGNLTPFKEAKVLSATSGIIQQIKFNLGDQVSEGQVLAIIDTRSAQLDLEKALASAVKIKHDLDTYTELLQGQAATQEKVSELQHNYTDALNQVNQVKKQISDAAIKAPTSGIIADKPVEQGVFANAGTQIATIVNLSQVKVQLNLTEAEVYQVKPNQQVKITTDVYPGKIFNGKITFISPQADVTHNYKIEIMAENKADAPLRSGTLVYADFSRKTVQNLLLIPRAALTQSVKDASVYVVENNIVHQKSITTGIEVNDMIQVLSGLKAGEKVVTSGQINLQDGAQVSFPNKIRIHVNYRNCR